jgi:hypothetical protein
LAVVETSRAISVQNAVRCKSRDEKFCLMKLTRGG